MLLSKLSGHAGRPTVRARSLARDFSDVSVDLSPRERSKRSRLGAGPLLQGGETLQGFAAGAKPELRPLLKSKQELTCRREGCKRPFHRDLVFPDAFIKRLEATLAALRQPEGISLSVLLVGLQPARRKVPLKCFHNLVSQRRRQHKGTGLLLRALQAELFSPGRLGARAAGQMLAGKLNPLFG